MQRHVGSFLQRSCTPRYSHQGRAAIAAVAALETKRSIRLQATPSGLELADATTNTVDPSIGPDAPDARFEVLGPTSSLLSVSLSASQELYTRRGTLIGASGVPENVISSLSSLSPLTRLPLGISFLYQKVTSTSPLSLLVGAKGHQTSFAVLHLDGRIDWTVANRNGLAAWTGQTLSVTPIINTKMSLAHWGNSVLTGRGLIALAASGHVYQLSLKTGEQYIAHPSNVLAYSINPTPPLPFRFKSSSLRLNIPSIRGFFPDSTFMRNMRATAVYKTLASVLYNIRTWTRRTLWGDRLFLQFNGPTTVLLQSRGSSLRESLTNRDVNEIADSPAGSAQAAVQVSWRPSPTQKSPAGGTGVVIPIPHNNNHNNDHNNRTKMSYASVGNDGKVTFSK